MNLFFIYILTSYVLLTGKCASDMDTDDSDTNLYGSDDSNDSSQDEICYIKDHKIVNNSMMLYVTWLKGGREWSDLENVQKDVPNLVKQYMEKKCIQ